MKTPATILALAVALAACEPSLQAKLDAATEFAASHHGACEGTDDEFLAGLLEDVYDFARRKAQDLIDAGYDEAQDAVIHARTKALEKHDLELGCKESKQYEANR